MILFFVFKDVHSSMKMSVWYTYVGREVGVQKCMCCETKEITQGDFECAHVIAEKKGGPNTVENLRPICSTCNNVLFYIFQVQFG